MSDKIKTLVEKARKAQAVVEFWPQEKVDEMIASVGWEIYERDNAEACAQLAFEETGMGIYKDKVLKHQKKILGTLRDLHGLKTVGVIEENKAKGLIKIVKPVGVIGALTPVTNPTSSVGVNGLPIIKTRNAVIFAPHPRAKKNCALTVKFMREGLKRVSAPEDLVQCIKEPTIELTQELMREVDLIVATGGAGMVKAAYSSGTPAFGVGAGNAVTIVDDTADLKSAAQKIFLGKTFDYATSCSSENSAIIQEDIFEEMLENFKSYGGYLCTKEEKELLKKALWPDGKHLNKKIVGQSPQIIAKIMGVEIPEGITFFMVLGDSPGESDLFSGEKLSVVLTLWKFKEFSGAIDILQAIIKYSGYGHSCGIHSNNDEHILELATKAHVSRMMVRQPQSYANSGNYDNGMPFSLTLGCGTWGGNITTENITWKHFVNITWVSKPIDPIVPNEEVIFGSYWEKFGK
ncbi:MAG TPA: aldehyde dehydrogenase family protein [Anaerolineae bacterium]|nr:aldehyde dehydrogenase family protein [Anaerolineae bacterium]